MQGLAGGVRAGGKLAKRFGERQLCWQLGVCPRAQVRRFSTCQTLANKLLRLRQLQPRYYLGAAAGGLLKLLNSQSLLWLPAATPRDPAKGGRALRVLLKRVSSPAKKFARNWGGARGGLLNLGAGDSQRKQALTRVKRGTRRTARLPRKRRGCTSPPLFWP